MVSKSLRDECGGVNRILQEKRVHVRSAAAYRSRHVLCFARMESSMHALWRSISSIVQGSRVAVSLCASHVEVGVLSTFCVVCGAAGAS